MADNDLVYWVWLNIIGSKAGFRKSGELISYFGDPKDIWKACNPDYSGFPFATPALIKQLLDAKNKKDAEVYLKEMKEAGIEIITAADSQYPKLLKNIYDPPVVLYVLGKLMPDEKTIAVVGSRNATTYGRGMAEKLSFELSLRGFTVVSGMARGVDSRAHKGALAAGGRTVAVLGCGPDVIYPPENERLMNEIKNNGAVITEYLPGVQPLKYNFPVRNRIISGISMGTVLIEAGEKSGSLITADLALEQGREVFALPGNVNSYYSKGTNRLIREGAKIVTDVDDILEEFGFVCCNEKNGIIKDGNPPIEEDLEGDELEIFKCIRYEPAHIDMIAQKSGLSIQDINSAITILELKGIVIQSPGKIFSIKN